MMLFLKFSVAVVAVVLEVVGEPRYGPRGAVLRLLQRLADIGARPGRTEDEILRQGTLIFASVLVAVLSSVWVVTYTAFGLAVSAAIPAAYQALTVVGLVVLSRTHNFGLFRTTQFVIFLVLPALLQASLGGFLASSGIILWAVLVPLAALAIVGLRRSVVWLVAYLAVVVVLAALDPRLSQNAAELPTGVVISFWSSVGRRPEVDDAKMMSGRAARLAAASSPRFSSTRSGALSWTKSARSAASSGVSTNDSVPCGGSGASVSLSKARRAFAIIRSTLARARGSGS